MESKDKSALQNALKNLELSISTDPNFFPPKYYKAVVKDVMGDYKEATKELQVLTRKAPRKYDPLVKYALAIALYHHYTETEVAQAVDILKQLEDKAGIDQQIKDLARAGKLQAEGFTIMLYGRKAGSHARAKSEKDRIEKEGKALTSKIVKSDSHYSSIEKEILWIAYNAMGLANMYASDSIRYEAGHDDAKDTFLEEFTKAKSNFDKAEEIAGVHWAIRSNMGSLEIRRAKFERFINDPNAANSYEKAKSIFDDILKNIRPEYDFAYYELGKLNRYFHKFDIAKIMFKRAKESGEKFGRNLRPESIISQLEKADDGKDTL